MTTSTHGRSPRDWFPGGRLSVRGAVRNPSGPRLWRTIGTNRRQDGTEHWTTCVRAVDLRSLGTRYGAATVAPSNRLGDTHAIRSPSPAQRRDRPARGRPSARGPDRGRLRADVGV